MNQVDDVLIAHVYFVHRRHYAYQEKGKLQNVFFVPFTTRVSTRLLRTLLLSERVDDLRCLCPPTTSLQRFDFVKAARDSHCVDIAQSL